MTRMTQQPPDGLPRYRLLVGSGEDDLSARVDEALQQGYVLHAGPAVTSNSGALVLVQAVRWPEAPAEPAATA